MAKRIYVVTSTENLEVIRLVRATSLPQAINFVSKPLFNGELASVDDIVKYRTTPVEDAVTAE